MPGFSNLSFNRHKLGWRMLKSCNLTIHAVTKSPIHVPTAAIFIKLSFLMPMYSVTM